MIIVEGPDGAGKSTLVQQLSQRLSYPIAPRVVDKLTRAMVDLQRWTDDNLAAGFQPTIFDRHRIISEPVYAPLLRPGSHTDFFNTTWLERSMREFYAIRPIIIYCLPPRGTVKGNVNKDTFNEVPAPHIDAIYDLYCARAMIDLARGDDLFVEIYDYTKSNEARIESLLNAVGGYVHHRMDSN